MTFSKVMPKLESRISSEIVARLKEVDPAFAKGALGRFKLGEVKDFSLAADAQHQGVPMWAVANGNPTQLRQARTALQAIAKSIIART